MSSNPATVSARTSAAWLVWTVGALAYILTVMQRTTLAAAGLDAARRFGLTPSDLAIFVFIQVAAFSVAQIPAGLMVDRYGPRAMLVANAVLLTCGQLMLAFVTAMPVAVAARVFVGVADAIVFTATLALIPQWFSPKRVPVMTQLTTIAGQLGLVLSAVPFVALLHRSGWPTAFTSVGAASALVGILAFVVVRNGPPGAWTPTAITSVRDIGGALKQVWGRPGTRLGFFGHMAAQFPMMVFSVLWGIPYLISGQHLSEPKASTLVTVFVVVTVAIGPLIGMLTSRYPPRRSWIILGVVAADFAIWTAILALPGPAPLWLLVVLVVILAAGGPGSVVGLDIARTANPRENIGVAQSIANLGGFSATLVVLIAMGAVMTAGDGFTPEAFRIAWLVMYPVWGFAVAGIIVSRRKTSRIGTTTAVAPG